VFIYMLVLRLNLGLSEVLSNSKGIWFKFYFPLFLDMVMRDNEFNLKQREITFKQGIKLNHNIYKLQIIKELEVSDNP